MAQPLTDAINALTTYANSVTGQSDSDLSSAVATLAAGYGQGGGETLPAEYTAVNYVQNSGDAYINMGIREHTNVITAMDGVFEAYNANSSSSKTLLGYQGTQVSTYRFTVQISTANTLQYYGAASGASSNIGGWNANGQNTIHIDFASNATYPVFTVNNIETTGNKKKTSTLGNQPYLYLMVSNYQNGVLEADTLVDGSYIRCYGFKLYCYDGLVRNYVPCIRNLDNKVGFYDFITETFYPSIGTNEFTSG